MYHQFAWDTPPPGPKPEGEILDKHEGFWQPPKENAKNLRPRYYEDLKKSDNAPLPEFLRIPGMGPRHAKMGLPGWEEKALDMGGELFHRAGW